MSMEVKNHYDNHYFERVQEEKTKKAAETVKEEKREKKESGIPIPKDEYISSEKADNPPSGLYRLGQDENGNSKVLYDKPREQKENGKYIQSEEEPVNKTEECTADTNQVDREIEKLKEDKKHLEQQIRTAAGDERKIKQLKEKLKQIEGELSQKDNDAYRRQRTVFR